MASVTATKNGWDIPAPVQVTPRRPSLLVSVGLSLALLMLMAAIAVGSYCAKRNRVRRDYVDG